MLFRSFTSSCFVVSNLIGKTNEWDQKLGPPTEKLMDHLQMQEWIKNNQEIGSHGKSHIDLTKTKSIQIEDEIKNSKSDIESVLGQKIYQFAFPFGSYDFLSREIVRSSGYLSALTSDQGIVIKSNCATCVPRIKIQRSDGA